MEIFSKRLKTLRIESGKLQTEISADMNFSQGMMSAYENGREPSFETLVSLARYFNVSTDYLLGLTSDKQPASDDVSSLLSTLASTGLMVEAVPLSVSSFVELFQLFITYYQKGAPAGNVPLDTMRAFVASMKNILAATMSGSTAETLNAVNDLVSRILDANNIMTVFLDNQKD